MPRVSQPNRGFGGFVYCAIPRFRINLSPAKIQIQSTGDDLPVGVPVLQNLQHGVSNRRRPCFLVSDGAHDIGVGSFSLDLLLNVRNQGIVRLRDTSSEFCRFLANLPVKRGAYKITRNREYPADGDEEERRVGEEDFVVEFDGLGVLSF